MDAAMSGAVSLVDEAATLFADFRDGRTDRLEQLVHLLTPTLWHVARGCGVSREDAEDIVQAAWVQLVDKADSVRSPQAILAWLGTTVRREAWRVSNERRRDIAVEEPPEVVDGVPGPAELALLDETASVLWRHFAALTPRCRALLRVICHGGRPDYAALAEALDMPVGSIGPTRGRCLATLRAALVADPTWSRS